MQLHPAQIVALHRYNGTVAKALVELEAVHVQPSRVVVPALQTHAGCFEMEWCGFGCTITCNKCLLARFSSQAYDLRIIAATQCETCHASKTVALTSHVVRGPCDVQQLLVSRPRAFRVASAESNDAIGVKSASPPHAVRVRPRS